MKVLTLWVLLSSSPAALDRDAVARLLQLSLTEAPGDFGVRLSFLPITLLGTLVDRAQLWSAALVLDGRRGRTVYLGDEILGARVVQIDRDRLVVERGGRREEIRTGAQPASAGAPPPAQGIHVSYADVQKSLPQLMTQIRAVPVANGFKVFSIAPDSLFARIGLKNGDVIHAGLELLQKVQPGAALTVEIEREGRTLSLSGWLD